MKNILKHKINLAFSLCFLIISNIAFAGGEPTNSNMSNADVFYLLVFSAIMLLLGIFFLSKSIMNLLKSDFYKQKFMEIESAKNKGNITNTLLILFLLSSTFSYSQEAISFEQNIGESISKEWVWGMAIINLLLIGILLYLRGLFFQILRTVKPKIEVEKTVPVLKSVTNILTDTVPIERENEILMDHEYDGIQELDNNLPPWWIWGFYISILFGVVYLTHYHVLKTGDLQTVEYNKSMIKAEMEVQAYLKNMAMNVDENTVTVLTDANSINSGGTIFSENCIACHGKQGQGVNGPNLTDNYWIHGGEIKNIFSTIKNGAPNGMKAWKDELSPIQIQQVASYIKSLNGSNPEGGKAPEGELFEDKTTSLDTISSVSHDTINIEIDSSKLN